MRECPEKLPGGIARTADIQPLRQQPRWRTKPGYSVLQTAQGKPGGSRSSRWPRR
jgi:hypothetical protein